MGDSGPPHGPGDVRFFDRIASVYDRLMPPVRVEDLQTGFRFADRPVERVLDVAGGTGRAARALDDSEVIVLDRSAGMLARAAEAGLSGVRGDARQLPIRDDAVDAVVVTDALHHVPDAEQALAACVRAVAPGGVIVIREFDPTTVRGRGLVALEHAAGMDSVFFEPRDLVAMLRDAGARSYLVEEGFGYTVVGVVPRESEAV